MRPFTRDKSIAELFADYSQKFTAQNHRIFFSRCTNRTDRRILIEISVGDAGNGDRRFREPVCASGADGARSFCAPFSLLIARPVVRAACIALYCGVITYKLVFMNVKVRGRAWRRKFKPRRRVRERVELKREIL